jgi:hypothetical protein
VKYKVQSTSEEDQDFSRKMNGKTVTIDKNGNDAESSVCSRTSAELNARCKLRIQIA